MDRAERDDLLLSGLAKPIGPLRYLFTGQQHTLHSFPELAKLDLFRPTNQRRFLPGSFIFEYKGKRHFELMETAESCGLRLTSLPSSAACR